MLIVDGHNLIGRAEGLTLEAEETARAIVLQKIAGRKGTRRDGVTVVFDGNRPGTAKRDRYGSVRVVFSPQGRSADEEILRLVQTVNPRTAVVVTSDRRLAQRARALGAATETCEVFWAKLEGRGGRRSSPAEKPRAESAEEREEWLRVFAKAEGRSGHNI
jgi:predicted RNA-binding protein with PIN domain